EGGAEVATVPDLDGRVDACAALDLLGKRGVTSVLAECGGTLAASLIAAGAVNKLLAFVAPRVAGGDGAPTPIGGLGVERMEQAIQLRDASWTALGQDMLLAGYVDGRNLNPTP